MGLAEEEHLTMEKEGKAGSYVESILKAVKSWLSHNHRKVETKIKNRGARDTPSLREERTTHIFILKACGYSCYST